MRHRHKDTVMRGPGACWRPLSATLAVVALLMTACAGGEAPPEASGKASDTASNATASSAMTKEVAVGAPGRAPRPAVSAPGARRTAQLVGLQGSDLALFLGPPSLVRRDPPAEVWQYAGPGCALHVFFYLGPDAGDYRVVHVESVYRGESRPEGDDCLARILKDAKRAGRSS